MAIVKIASESGSEMDAVAFYFGEGVMRMVLGDIDSVKVLREASIIV